MASIPPRQRRTSPTQRSSSPEASSSASQSQSQSLNRADSEAHSTISIEDSQTILLNPSSSSRHAKQASQPSQPPSTTPQTQATISTQTSSPLQEAAASDPEPKKCWICFSDSTEDDPASTPTWRSPCPCALEAHEACLLDWIADLESPASASSRRRAPNAKILCPQCKEEIHLSRPRSYVVDAVKSVEVLGHRLVLPGSLVVGVSSFWYLCWAHGASSVMLVFGERDGKAILAPLLRPPPSAEASLSTLLEHWRARVRLDLGLFCIPGMLIFARTTLADGILPILPILFFVTKPDADPFQDVGVWPPSAGLSFAMLPYLRSVYNACYERVWGEHEKRWWKEIQPRAAAEAQEGGGDADNAAGNVAAQEGDDMIEVNIDLGILDEWEEEEEDEEDEAEGEEQAREIVQEIQQDMQAHPIDEPPLDVNADANANANVPAAAGQAEAQPGIPAVAPPPDVPRQRRQRQPNNAPAANPANAPPAPQNRADRNLNVAISTTKLFESVLGALAFPAVSAVMGEALRLLLPKSWTTFKPSWWAGKPTGLLQQKWGRSLVGGAVFVVLKDAVMLYVKWRMARDHRMRRVLDYTGKRGVRNRTS